MLSWEYTTTRLFVLFKIQIRLLESDQKCSRRGITSSTKPLLSFCKGDNNRKTYFLKSKFTGHLVEKNDVKHNIFCFIIPLIWMILL